MIFAIIDFYYRRKRTFIVTVTIITLIIIAVPLFLCFKGYNYPKMLIEIDSVCNVNPSKADKMLKAYIAKTSNIHGEEKWLLRLLTLKSTIKANKKIDDDNEAKALIKHYENNGDKNLLSDVYYCAGCTYNLLMDIPQANIYFFKGIKLLDESKDKKTLALFCYQLGQNFLTQGLHKEAYYWEAKSLAINKEIKDTTRCIYDYMNIAWTLGNLGEPRKALEVMIKAKDLAESAHDKSVLSEIDCQITNHCLELGMLHKAKRHIDDAIQEKESDRSELYSIALETYMRLGENKKIKEYSDSVMRHGNVYGKRYAYWCLMKQAVKSNDFRNATEYMKQYKAYDDSAKRITAAEASAKAHALYNYKLREDENIRLLKDNAAKNLFIIIISAVLVISLLSAYIIYIRIKQQKRTTEERCKMLAEQLKEIKETNADYILEKEHEIETIKRKLQEDKHEGIRDALNAKQAELEKLNKRKKQIEDCTEKITKTDVYKQIQCILKGYDSKTFTNWNDLEKTVYDCFPNFETSLHNLGDLNFTELKVCLLTRIGLSVKDISIVTCASKSSIYSINQRLFYKKFGKYAASSDWIEFIRTIY